MWPRERSIMKGSYRLIMTMVTTVVAVATMSSAAASASPRMARVGDHSVALLSSRSAEHGASIDGTLVPAGAYNNCSSGYFCDFIYTNGNHECFKSSNTQNRWSDFGCRNVDESLANRTSGLVRLYYSPNKAGAWVCLDSGFYSNNLSPYTFDNGQGRAGYGYPVNNDVASSEVGTGSCSNPL
jgi:Peptidase inhibitor family I36